MAGKSIKTKKPLMMPKITVVPFSALQEKGGMFFEPGVTNPKGKQNPMEKRRDLKSGKKQVLRSNRKG